MFLYLLLSPPPRYLGGEFLHRGGGPRRIGLRRGGGRCIRATSTAAAVTSCPSIWPSNTKRKLLFISALYILYNNTLAHTVKQDLWPLEISCCDSWKKKLTILPWLKSLTIFLIVGCASFRNLKLFPPYIQLTTFDEHLPFQMIPMY